MAATINTNIASINAQRNLSLSGQSLNTTMQRLSSGLRVNSAKDDAAGLAIAERMNTQVKGMTVASRNANDGISLAQTTEGALGKIGDMLQRMRELAVQAGNATNSASDRVALQLEVKQMADEIDRVAKQTNFNGQKVLDGSFAGAVFQVGANSGDNITLGALVDTRSSQISNINYSANEQKINVKDDPTRAIADFDQKIEAGTLKMTIGAGADAYTVELGELAPAESSLERIGQVITAINNKSADTGVTAYMTMKEGTSEYTIETLSSKLDTEGKPVPVLFEGFGSTTTGIGAPATDVPAQGLLTELGAAAGVSPFDEKAQKAFEQTLARTLANNPALVMHNDVANAAPNPLTAYQTASPPTNAEATTLASALSTAATAYKTAPFLATLKDTYEKVMQNPSSTQNAKADAAEAYRAALNTYLGSTPAGGTPITNAMPPATFNTAIATLNIAAATITFPNDLSMGFADEKLDQRGIEDIDVSTQAGAWVALKKIDSAIDQVNSARATLGAVQARFENTVNNIDIQVENLSAARGRIIDADFAKETANLSRTQILQQAGTAMVAQANQIPQNVLQLLQG